MGAGDTLEKKTTIHSFPPPPSIVLRGVALITSQMLRMDLVDFFVPNTFQTGEEKGRGWGGRHFQPVECFSVCLCESKVWVCSSATFYGKVSFPPLCPQRLPDTDRACSLCMCVCVWSSVCVENRRCWFQRAAQEEAEFRSCWSLWGEGSSSKSASVRLSLWTGFVFPSCGCGELTSCFWFWAWRFPAWPSQWC